MNFWIAFISAIFITSCNKEDSKEPVLNLVSGAKIKGMDPIYANDAYSAREVTRVYEGLLTYHYLKRPYTLIANLAESIPKPSKDKLTYIFKIKKNVFFHNDKAFKNGKKRELVAEDFVYSIKRLADPKLQGLGWWLLEGKIKGLNQWREKYADKPKVDYSEVVEGLKALDRYTLQIKLAKPFPQFLYALAMPFTFAVAKEAVDYYGKEFLNHPVGTGPYTLERFTQSNKIIYYKNKNYRKVLYPCDASSEFKQQGLLKDCGKTIPFVDKVVVNIITESLPRWLNFQKGKLDYVGIPKDNFDTAVPDAKNLAPDFIKKGMSLNVTPSLDVTYIAFNHDLKLFSNLKLRRAMSLAYNVSDANRLFYNNTAIAAQSIVPPGISGHIKSYKNPYKGYGTTSNLQNAKKLLAEAGYPNGKGLPIITYDTPNSTVSRQFGEYFKKQMQKIGINIKISQSPWPEFQKKIQDRKVMLYGIAWGADYPDAENFLQLLYGPNRSPGANGSGYDNPKFNRIFKKAVIMSDSPKRTKLYENLNKMAAEEVPWIFGVHRQSYTLYQGWLKNFIFHDFVIGQEKYLNIDLESKKKILKML